MLVVRCKDCNKEITSHPTKTQCCGCSNMMTVKGDGISAVDLSKVVMVNSIQKEQKNVLSSTDLAYQEARRQRKVRKLDFEVR
jgi:hypothetical protein